MKIGIPKEIHAHERRVACTPQETTRLRQLGYEILLERGAGENAGFPDTAYQRAGAKIIGETRALWQRADLICKVRPPQKNPTQSQSQSKNHEAALLTADKTLLSLFAPAHNQPLLKKIAAQGATVLAIDAIPRISRAQKMDALSAMANLAGYRAVVEAAHEFGRFFSGQITAAGNLPPAKILVIGAGVAGLSAIGAAVSMGAIVRAFDTRPEVKEQIASLNAEFLQLDIAEDASGHGGYAKTMSAKFIQAEKALFAAQAREVDIIITTALIPGVAAPKLITSKMVATMKPGSVIVDLAAEQGGNCELTEADKLVTKNGVRIIGYTDLPSRMPTQASELYAATLRHLLTELTPQKDGKLHINAEDPIHRACTIAQHGRITYAPPAPPAKPTPTSKPQSNPTQTPTTTSTTPTPKLSLRRRAFLTATAMTLGIAAILALGQVAPPSFMSHFIVFVLACFVGWQVIWKVTPVLHTPLMSVTNAISSIIVIGALLQSNSVNGWWLALAALFLASINIAGGFLVTQRMLKMFKK